MFCSSCGSKNFNKDAIFCSSCGAAADGEKAALKSNKIEDSGLSIQKNQQRSKRPTLFKSKKFQITLIVSLVAVLVSVFAVLKIQMDERAAREKAIADLASCAKLIGNNDPNEPYITLIFSAEEQITFANMETIGLVGEEKFAQCLVEQELVSVPDLDRLFVEMSSDVLVKLIPNFQSCSASETVCLDPTIAPYFTNPPRASYSTELLDFDIRWTNLTNRWTCDANGFGNADECAVKSPGDSVMVQFEASLMD
jgi:uncharacterized Zn finger protein (UPF0148 family)